MLNDLYILQIQSLKGYKGKRTGIKSLSYLYPQDLVDAQQMLSVIIVTWKTENRKTNVVHLEKAIFKGKKLGNGKLTLVIHVSLDV